MDDPIRIDRNENRRGARQRAVHGCGAAACWFLVFAGWAAGAETPQATSPASRPRARDLGIHIGILPTGPNNGITDVAGVLVGHQTLRVGDDVRTGVTAIRPHGGNLFQDKVPAAIVVGNGFGKLVGSTQVAELGVLETPIVLTNTLSVFVAADAVIEYTISQPGNEDVRSVNPLVGETNDGFLNNIRARRIRSADVLAAIHNASADPVEEGAVGAGTGTRCLGFKGGIGTASRRLPQRVGGYTLGVLVQSNFGGILTVDGAPVGRELGGYYLEDLVSDSQGAGGSCMIVVATDAPLDARQLKRLGQRALLGLAAVGSPMSHGSGDYVISFSAHPGVRQRATEDLLEQPRIAFRDEALSPLFQACREATEEAIVNSLLRARTERGFQGREVRAVPIEQLLNICRDHGVVSRPDAKRD